MVEAVRSAEKTDPELRAYYERPRTGRDRIQPRSPPRDGC